MLNIIKNTINRVFASGVDSDASAFITATGLSGTTQKSAITTLVKDLKSSGLWSKMKAVYPMVTDNYNLLSYTEDITNGAWGKNISATFSANTTAAPNGTLTADTIGSNGGVSSSIFQLADNNGNGVYTTSIYVKQKTNRYFKLALTGFTGATQRYAVIVDMSNGTLISELNTSPALTNKSYSIVDAGNGWYRISVTATVPSSSFVYLVFECTNSTSTSINASNLDYINATAGECYIWGAQIQTGTLTTYQPILTTPAAFMASQMKYNLKDARDLDVAFRLTWSGGWTYSATGATPNGTNAFADTKLATNILGLDSAHLSLYSRTNSNGTIIDIGSSNSASAGYDFQLVSRFSNINYSILNSKSPTGFAQTTSLGFALVSRVLSTGYAYFLNNSKTSVTKASDTRNSFNIYIAARNTANVAEYFSNRETAFASIGDGLTDQDAQLLNQITEKYQVALSRGVQAAQSFYYNSAYSNEANTYLYSTQITGTTQVSAINTLINGLKANNLWTKMKAVYPFVTDKTLQADMAAQMKFNLVNPQDSDDAFRLAFSGGWTYSTNGAQPNGTNGFADTKLVPSTSLSTSSAHFSKYNRTNDLVSNKVDGALSTDTFKIIQHNYSAGNGIIGETASLMSYTPTDTRGLFTAIRTSASLGKVFRNSTQVSSSTLTITGLPNRTIYLGGRNDGPVSFYNSYQAAFASIGDGLTDAEAALLYQLVQQFQTDLSRQV
jgi:hypothetical protein